MAYSDTVAEAIGGLFSDMFSTENGNSGVGGMSAQNIANKNMQDAQKGSVGKAVGTVINTVAQANGRILMMNAMRSTSSSSGAKADALAVNAMDDDDDFDFD